MEVMVNNIKRYNFLDLTKFLFAILLVCAHFASREYVNFPTIVDLTFSLYIVVVPFFFATSGFLLQEKMYITGKSAKATIVPYVKRIVLMYILWSVIYICFVIADWVIHGVSIQVALEYLHKSIVYSTYPTIWFLPALVIASSFSVIIRDKFGMNTLLIISGVLFLVGTLGYTYRDIGMQIPIFNQLLITYEKIFITTRNGFWCGIPYFVIGMKVADKKDIEKSKAMILTCVFFILMLVEAFTVKSYLTAKGVDTVIFLIPFMYYFLLSVLQIEIPDNKLFSHLRKLSTLLFLSQRIWLTAIPTLLPYTLVKSVYGQNPFIGLIIILLILIISSETIILLSSKYSKLKIFY